MIRRSPCELYIKFLLCHPDAYSLDAARAIIYKQQLDWVDDNYAKGLKDRMAVPNPFYPTNLAHKPSVRFVHKEKLAGFFTPDEPARIAHTLLQDARAKETIETMALTRDQPAFISHRLRTMGIHSTVLAVQRYLTYYWDLRLVDTLEINALLQMRREVVLAFPSGPNNEPTVHDRMQYAALNKVKYRDPRAMVLSMPVSPIAGLMNQLRQGIMPKRVELAAVAKAAQMAATFRVFEATMVGGPGGGAATRDYALGAKMMGELIQELGSPEAELQKGLQQLALKNEDARLPLLSDLSGGSHTTDLQPAAEATAEEIEDDPGT
jgi:hypothetical protein